MTLRSFVDPRGCMWDVWEVHAIMKDRRRLADRRVVKRPTFERRVADFISWLVTRQKGRSWLVFRSVLGRWRLSPVPYDWERASDAALFQLITQGVRARDVDGGSTAASFTPLRQSGISHS